MSARRLRLLQARTTARALQDGVPEAVVADARAALAMADHAIAEHVVELSASGRLACAPRCAHCCRLDVALTFSETAVLADFVQERLAPAELAALRQRLQARVEEDAGFAPDAPLPSGRPCPLLVDELCCAYEARPLACRGWNSADAQACAQAAARPGDLHVVPVHRVLRDAGHQTACGLQDGARELGLDDDALDLPRALHALLGDPDGLTDAWLQGRKLPPALRSRASGARAPQRVSGDAGGSP